MSNLNTNILITPYGSVKFLAVSKPVLNFAKTDKEFVARAEFDGSTEEGAKLKATIMELDSRKVITKGVTKPDNFILTFKSKFKPVVLDETGNRLEEDDVPMFDSRTDSGQVRIEAAIVEREDMTTLYLTSVQLNELTIVEKEDLRDQATQLEVLIKKAAGK